MTVTHVPERHRFLLETSAGEAELHYRLRPDGVMVLAHTFVPEGARGGTVASDLVEAAIAYARTHQVKLAATCPYVQSWLKRHPEQRELFVN